MGKRELMLIIGFITIAVVVYQATAPPPDPSDRSLSIGRLMEAARREIHGNRAHVRTSVESTHPVDTEIAEVRVQGRIEEVEIAGEERNDIQAALRVNSHAYNDAEAKQYAAETKLVSDRAGSSFAFRVKYPQPGRQRTALSLKIPSRMRVRIEPGAGNLTITNVAAVETLQSGGTATITNVSGRVAIEHRGGKIDLEGAQSLKLSARGTELKIARVGAETAIRLEGGELTASQLHGPVEIEARNADVTLAALESTRGPIRVNISGGSARLGGVKADTRVDARQGEVDVVVTGAAPITIYNDGEDVALTLPRGGYRLDALASGGRITPVGTSFDQLKLTVEAPEPPDTEFRASGAVNGGGPAITVRATRGDVTLRAPETAK